MQNIYDSVGKKNAEYAATWWWRVNGIKFGYHHITPIIFSYQTAKYINTLPRDYFVHSIPKKK